MSKYERFTISGLTDLIGKKNDFIYARLSELEDKIENRTLVEFPCKTGDNVYIVDKNLNKVKEDQVIAVNVTVIDNEVFQRISTGFYDEISGLSFGREVFFDKEQAIARLKELQEVPNDRTRMAK